MEEESESERVKGLIKKQVGDWDDEVMSRARFKAFSGQRSDWLPLYLFWKHLILTVARQLGVFVITDPPQLKHRWFTRGGLTPLSLDHVLLEMYKEGEIVASGDLVDPTAGRVSRIFTRLSKVVLASRITTPELLMSQDRLIFTSLLQDKSAEVVRLLSDSESHWTSSCIVTMKRFRDVCGGPVEASAVLSHLSAQGKARYLSLSKGDFIEGVKISLSASSVPGISSLDSDVLHLVWTTEKLQQQLDVIDQRYQTSRKSALACLNSGNKKVALRHARELKLASESREKCVTLLNRVEEVIAAIASAESTKKVSEAIKSGAQAMKENKISVEEVEHSLQEVEEAIDAQKQVQNALESTSLYTDDEESIEEEFKKLELEIGLESLHEPLNGEVHNAESSKSAESLIDSLSNLKLVDDNLARAPVEGIVKTTRNNKTKTPELETA